MSPLAEDSDPLLAFSTEQAAASPVTSPPQKVVQPVAPVEDARSEPPEPPVNPLSAKVIQLERALEMSNQQVLSLKSEVATLVRALGDIKRSAARPVTTTPAPPRVPRPSMRAAAAVIGIVLGIGLGILAWMYLSGDANSTIAAPAPVSREAPPANPSPAVESSVISEAPTPSAFRPVNAPQSTPHPAEPARLPEPPKAPAVKAPAAKAPKAAKVAEPAPSTPYVGTLSIDASPGGEVFVDRQSVGTSPVRLVNLRAGSHLIWIERQGYRRFTRVVQVTADNVTRLSAELELLPAR
ncbi:MAG TPA: PEGA domain-containing protein [Vicinamibacterales bacterium]|nr:PEGA domain-containing protein [Vicinamibacterales bacterium]